MVTRNTHWTETDIPEQTGRTVLITGANSGLGLNSARILAGKGAKVLLACRSAERGQQALRAVEGAADSAAAPELISLDLADLASVRAGASTARELSADTIDILINNAGLMGVPQARTKDGFELQFGTNHLGHAALTWLLMPALRNSAHGGRVVTLSSAAAQFGKVNLTDPNFENRRYNAADSYGQSKRANQMFTLELDRRLRSAGSDVISVGAHPGYATTGLAPTMAGSQTNPVIRTIMTAGVRVGELLLAQDSRMGTLPQLFAATEPTVSGGDYIGPNGLGGARGYPQRVSPLRDARDPAKAAGLWDLTAKLTGITPDPA